MDKLIVCGVVSGITIAVLWKVARELSKENRRLRDGWKDAEIRNHLMDEIIQLQYQRPDEAGIMVTEELETKLEAYKILRTNGI